MPNLWSKIRRLIEKEEESMVLQHETDWATQNHATPEVQVVVRRPCSFDEGESIAALIKSNQAVVVNFEGLPVDIAQRLVDYLSGATYALDGNMEKIGMAIFLFAPVDVNIHIRDFLGLNMD
ncbi:MAG TPA: cell division protein SepF [bacterium]|nr:cell division protein SepF [bacterium]